MKSLVSKNFILLVCYLMVKQTSCNGDNFPLWKNHLLATIPEWGKEWHVSFEIMPKSSKVDELTNIIQFSEGGACCNAGQRIPGVWFEPGTTKLSISSAIDDKGNYLHNDKKDLPLNMFTHVAIQQIENEQGVYTYSITINGTVIHSVTNKQPKVFKNISVYASSPWYTAADAILRNVRYTVEPEIKGNIQKGKLLTTLNSWGKEWRISFKILPLSKENEWTNILHLTTGGNCCVHGTRIPAVGFKPNTFQLSFTSSVSTEGAHGYNFPKDLPTGKYTEVRIEQLQEDDGKFYYKIFIEDKLVYKILQTNARDYSKVRVYAGSPWYTSAHAYIRDLHFEVICGQHFFTNF